ncbi:bacteriocin [Lactococcus lactis]|uniref:bacteriocin n=1 Tax=Lactococcus lactis TaxID=1358 RepID=UPI00191276E3|nr:bacteriocin [Lactococcus lactis]WDA67460.1 bacteriocin [Lactococcus lactis]WDA67469.1 bacteriocin [Lactococcus lactis]
MKKDEIIKLSNGQKATLVRGDESQLKNTYIVRLESGELRVVDRKTLTLAESLGDTKSKHSYYHK